MTSWVIENDTRRLKSNRSKFFPKSRHAVGTEAEEVTKAVQD
jgi:hypothetical protein